MCASILWPGDLRFADSFEALWKVELGRVLDDGMWHLWVRFPWLMSVGFRDDGIGALLDEPCRCACRVGGCWVGCGVGGRIVRTDTDTNKPILVFRIQSYTRRGTLSEGRKTENPLPGMHCAKVRAAETTLLHTDENNDQESVHTSHLSHYFASTDFHLLRGGIVLLDALPGRVFVD